jgi:mannitol 2-dehydrogenase
VADAMRDSDVPVLLERFLDRTVLPLLTAPTGVDLDSYKRSVLDRFANEAMHDQLVRIASDGASKLPVYFGATLKEMLAGGLDHRLAAFTLAAYSRVLQGRADDGRAFDVIEPHLDETCRRRLTEGEAADALRVEPLQASGVADDDEFVASFAAYRAALGEQGTRTTLKALLEATT